MILINLLPYREQRRRRQVLMQLAGAVAAIACVVTGLAVWHVHLEGSIADAESRLADLQQKNEELEKQIGEIKTIDALRAEVEKKLRLVDMLQGGRFRSLEMLHELSRRIPQNVWLTRFEDADARIRLEGLAENNKAIADFMRQLDRSNLFQDIRLESITRQQVRGYTLRQFSLTVYRRSMDQGESMQPVMRRGR